jgi:protein-tyrosine phosphatase
MAEALLKQALPGHAIRSAGIGALIGKPADPLAVQLMAEKGIDIKEHRAQQVLSSLVAQAQLILVMDSDQKRYVESSFVGSRGKVYRLAEAVKADIPDPYREGIESFRVSLSLIEEGVNFWAMKLRQMS